MAEPKCPECEGTKFAVKSIGDNGAVIYCTGCGHIVGAGYGGSLEYLASIQ